MNRVARLSAKTFRQIESSGKVPQGYSVLSLMIGLKLALIHTLRLKRAGQAGRSAFAVKR